MDDIVVIGDDLEDQQTLQSCLAREFEMKDLSPLKYLLGIEMARSKNGFFLL